MKLIIPIISFSLLFAQENEMYVKDIIKAMDNNLNAKSYCKSTINSKNLSHNYISNPKEVLTKCYC